MAEYITIMVINNKAPGESEVFHVVPLFTLMAAQITTELEDCMLLSLHSSAHSPLTQLFCVVIGSEYGKFGWICLILHN